MVKKSPGTDMCIYHWIKYQKFTRIILCAVIMISCKEPALKVNQKLITLKNDRVEIGIVPDLGGRIVLLRQPGRNNILKSDPTQWHDPQSRPEVSAFSDFKAFNGHIVWLSPQSEWWIKQDINRERRDSKALWPPDPYLIYGDFKITEQTDTSITLLGPESPVSGVQLTKKISFNSTGVVTFDAAAKNIRKQPLSWGLWLNTRFDGAARCYVQANANALLKLAVTTTDGKIKPMPCEFIHGYFTFRPPAAEDSLTKYVQKAFINPAETFIVGFSQGQAIQISFKYVPPAQIHSDQAPVEIYNTVSTEESLLELEIHGPYRTLLPGESMHLTETWRLFKYDGENTVDSQINFINETLRGKH